MQKNFVIFSLINFIFFSVLTGCGCSIFEFRPVKKIEKQAPLEINKLSVLKSSSKLLESSHAIGDMIARTLAERLIDKSYPIMAASFVNINKLTESTTLGRVISEQIASRLAQHGYKIIEIKLRQESVFVKEGHGEFMLSRELQDIAINKDIYAVLVGTYAISDRFIFVSARMVLTKDSTVIAGQEYELPLDSTIKSLLTISN